MIKFSKSLLTLFVGTVFMIASGCTQQNRQSGQQGDQPETNYTRAVAVLHTVQGEDVSGTVHLEKTGEGVRVTARVEGLETGNHGFHIHRYGDCSAADFTSAGGHFNPTGQDHGAPTQDNRHMGDMGNLAAGEDGTADIDYVDPVIKLNGADGVIGRAIVIHAGADDFESQPSGAAGPRIACGVIGIDGPERGNE